MSRSYRIVEGSIQDEFFRFRSKFQMYAGGYGNGKTSATCVRVLQIARDYPGASILMARATFPKLNDTFRKEMLVWCPTAWIKHEPTDSNNNLILHNGTTIAFRYIAQQGKSTEQSSSNLLSATYDLVAVDQIEDPEITHKDFTDLSGRLRGKTPYKGDDPTMPRTGPRWFLMTANPSRNWVYRKLVRPLEIYRKSKIKHPDLLVDANGDPWLDVANGPTSANMDNLPADYLDTLKTTHRGQSFARFVEGKWTAFDGLVYPDFDLTTHVIPHDVMRELYQRLTRFTECTILVGLDYGLSSPTCVLFAFVDMFGNVHVCDGFYQSGMKPDKIAERYRAIAEDWNCTPQSVFADPQIFKQAGTVGATVSDMLSSHGVPCVRGNNAIYPGITKIGSYLAVSALRKHPYTGNNGSPRLFVSDKLAFLADEFSEYVWQRDTSDESKDRPRDRNDHALDALKYLMTPQPEVAKIRPQSVDTWGNLMTWHELDRSDEDARAHTRRFVG